MAPVEGVYASSATGPVLGTSQKPAISTSGLEIQLLQALSLASLAIRTHKSKSEGTGQGERPSPVRNDSTTHSLLGKSLSRPISHHGEKRISTTRSQTDLLVTFMLL